jgi:hypothetical protein
VLGHLRRLLSLLSWAHLPVGEALSIWIVAIVRLCVLVMLEFVSAGDIAVIVKSVFVLLTPLDVGWADDAVVDFSRCSGGKCDRAPGQ